MWFLLACGSAFSSFLVLILLCGRARSAGAARFPRGFRGVPAGLRQNFHKISTGFPPDFHRVEAQIPHGLRMATAWLSQGHRRSLQWPQRAIWNGIYPGPGKAARERERRERDTAEAAWQVPPLWKSSGRSSDPPRHRVTRLPSSHILYRTVAASSNH